MKCASVTVIRMKCEEIFLLSATTATAADVGGRFVRYRNYHRFRECACLSVNFIPACDVCYSSATQWHSQGDEYTNYRCTGIYTIYMMV